MTSRETPIHIRLDYQDTLISKKNILLAEKDFLESIKHIRAYNQLRKKEFSVRANIKKNLSAIKNSVIQIKSSFPEHEDLKLPKLPKSLEQTRKKEKQVIKKIEPRKQRSKDTQLEDQIREIQEKLARLD